MLKWITSVILLLTVTGQVWAGICGCFDDHSGVDLCCKSDESGKASFSAKTCCAADCASISSNDTPGQAGSDRSASKPYSSDKLVPVVAAVRPAVMIIPLRPAMNRAEFGHRLKFARPPTLLFVRHSSFLI